MTAASCMHTHRCVYTLRIEPWQAIHFLVEILRNLSCLSLARAYSRFSHLPPLSSSSRGSLCVRLQGYVLVSVPSSFTLATDGCTSHKSAPLPPPPHYCSLYHAFLLPPLVSWMCNYVVFLVGFLG